MDNQFKQTPIAAAISGGLSLPADFLARQYKGICHELKKLGIMNTEPDEIQNEFWVYCMIKPLVIARMRRMGRTDMHIFNAWRRYYIKTQEKRRSDYFADSLDATIGEGDECFIDNLCGDLNEGGEIAAWRAEEFSEYEKDWARRHTPEAIQARLGCDRKTAENHFKKALETAEYIRENGQLFNYEDFPEVSDEEL
ncbi:MAG: hypothetical protein KGJ74_10010, partial [Betaproteobacteria bacterium]|nr:hypothetical protein [Betaproteobacteria bacterium]